MGAVLEVLSQAMPPGCVYSRIQTSESGWSVRLVTLIWYVKSSPTRTWRGRLFSTSSELLDRSPVGKASEVTAVPPEMSGDSSIVLYVRSRAVRDPLMFEVYPEARAVGDPLLDAVVVVVLVVVPDEVVRVWLVLLHAAIPMAVAIAAAIRLAGVPVRRSTVAP